MKKSGRPSGPKKSLNRLKQEITAELYLHRKLLSALVREVATSMDWIAQEAKASDLNWLMSLADRLQQPIAAVEKDARKVGVDARKLLADREAARAEANSTAEKARLSSKVGPRHAEPKGNPSLTPDEDLLLNRVKGALEPLPNSSLPINALLTKLPIRRPPEAEIRNVLKKLVSLGELVFADEQIRLPELKKRSG